MKKYKSEALMVIHQDAQALHRLGIIDDGEMKEYNKGCLVKEPKISNKTETFENEQLSHAIA